MGEYGTVELVISLCEFSVAPKVECLFLSIHTGFRFMYCQMEPHQASISTGKTFEAPTPFLAGNMIIIATRRSAVSKADFRLVPWN